MIDLKTIEDHYTANWGHSSSISQWTKGPSYQLPSGFRVLTFAPNKRRTMWTYATLGMSHQAEVVPIELHMFSPTEHEGHIELLTAIAHYHLTSEYLGLGHTVNFGRPWLPDSSCDRGLVSLPYLDGPALEWLKCGEQRVRFLWLVPITSSELRFAKAHGVEALEARFEERQFNYLDPLRESVA